MKTPSTIFRRILFFIIRITGIPYIIREFIQKRVVTIIFFHSIDKQRARKFFKYFQKNYRVISLQEYLKHRFKKTPNNLPKKSLIITFDDGLKKNYELLPILKKLKIPITIFVSSGIINTKRNFWVKFASLKKSDKLKLKDISNKKRIEYLKYIGFNEKKEYRNRQALNLNEIKKMESFVDFQSHSVFHPLLTKCTDKRSKYEIEQSKKDLESLLETEINTFSFPFGDYSEREIKFIKKAGYEAAVTADAGYNKNDTNLFKLKRLSIYDGATYSEMIVKTSGFWQHVKRMCGKKF